MTTHGHLHFFVSCFADAILSPDVWRSLASVTVVHGTRKKKLSLIETLDQTDTVTMLPRPHPLYSAAATDLGLLCRSHRPGPNL